MQLEVYQRLLAAYGHQHWWPTIAEHQQQQQTEITVGAILVQNTAWRNVEQAIANLHQQDLLDVERLYALPEEELQTLIRPAGYYRLKAQRLRNLLRLVVEQYGSLQALFALPTDKLRTALLTVSGVGPETADSILLYAAQRPKFVIDTYTRRVVERHAWREDLSYDALQQWFEDGLPAETSLFNEYHALIVEVGKHHCGTKPRCEGCPLEALLP